MLNAKPNRIVNFTSEHFVTVVSKWKFCYDVKMSTGGASVAIKYNMSNKDTNITIIGIEWKFFSTNDLY